MSLEPRGAEASPAELGTAASPRRPSLWRQRDFLKLWTAQTISQFGDEITGIALPLVATVLFSPVRSLSEIPQGTDA